MDSENIVITGAGIVSSIGIGTDAVAESLRAHRTGIGTMRFLPSRHHELPVGEVKLSNDGLRRLAGAGVGTEMSRTTLMGIIAARQAMSQARVPHDGATRVLLVSGTTVAGMDITERRFADAVERGASPDWFDHHDCGSCTADMARTLGGFTDYTTISTACSSAANALIFGADMLKAGEADIVVAGGTEALSRFHLNGFNSLMILDHDVCRPFDDSRAGLNLGEGAAYVVLERESDATRRGAGPMAWLTGYGNACDAFHQTASSPDDTGAQIAMRKALEMARLNVSDIQWVHAHGTGTPDNDRSEARALRGVFGGSMPMVSSTKGFTGHTTSASGSISAVISLIAMHQGFVPVSLGFSNAMPEGIMPVSHDTAAVLHNVMVNSFGFGGNDSSLILSDAPRKSEAAPSPGAIKTADEAKAVAITTTSPVSNDSLEALKDIRRYVKPMEARRMGKLMKSTLLTSLQALEEAHVDMPDAIVTATAWGSLEYSEQLLQQLAEDDDTFKPTYFMQSTHNTIGSLIAIHLKCHGYNITFSQGADSLRWAMLQARLLLRSGRYRSVLVGCHDESTPLFNRFLGDMGRKPLPPVSSVAMVMKADDR